MLNFYYFLGILDSLIKTPKPAKKNPKQNKLAGLPQTMSLTALPPIFFKYSIILPYKFLLKQPSLLNLLLHFFLNLGLLKNAARNMKNNESKIPVAPLSK